MICSCAVISTASLDQADEANWVTNRQLVFCEERRCAFTAVVGRGKSNVGRRLSAVVYMYVFTHACRSDTSAFHTLPPMID